jgi:anti-sigma factor RsiW
MNHTNPPATEHEDIWNLLPWLVNGRLNEADCRRVEAHLRLCSSCRDEFAAQRRIYQIIAADAAVEQMPTAGLHKLRQRIESYESAGPAHAESDTAPRARPRSPDRATLWRRLPRSSIAASVVGIAVALGVSAALLWNQAPHGERASYYTVTTAASQPAGAVIRAVFAPTVTLSELQALLDDAHLRIVSGPTEAGVYSLALTGSQPIDWSLRRLRGHDTVRFAETIGPASAAAQPR